MAWIVVHQSLPNHKKTLRMRRTLKITQPQAVGHLCMLWLWCIDNAPDADLSEVDNIDIAEAAGWAKDADVFTDALIASGFITEDRQIHNWDEYAGKLTQKREANAKRMREARAQAKKQPSTSAPGATNVQRTCDAHDAHGQRTCEATVPNSTQPNSTVPNQENDAAGGSAHAREELPDDFPPGSGAAYCRDNLRYMSPGNYADMRGYMEDGITDELLHLAVDESCAKGGRSWGYVRRVLDRWLTSGIRTAGDVKADRERFEQLNGERGHPPDKGSPRSTNGNIFADMLQEELNHESG